MTLSVKIPWSCPILLPTSPSKLRKMQKAAPRLLSCLNDVKNFLIDIDGTITEDVPNEQPGAHGHLPEPFSRRPWPL